LAENGLGDATEKQSIDACPSMSGERDQIDTELPRPAQDYLTRWSLQALTLDSQALCHKVLLNRC
jgi:hypothetical protein